MRADEVACVTDTQSVIFFYGADDAPSCSKQIAGMDAALPEFDKLGVKVVGGVSCR